MSFFPLYNEPVFRPPAEANSAIIQVTLGCSWNKCAFCEMYSTKNFRIKPFNDLVKEIKSLSKYFEGSKKIFLADGNAFILSTNNIIPILKEIHLHFGKIQRVSSYALPKDILSKSHHELTELRDLGLKLLYIGIESGDDELLRLINKSETSQSTLEGILKAQNAGIDTSLMVLIGLGGKNYSMQHALNSAKLINQINPKFLSTLTLSLPYGLDHFQKKFKGTFVQQTIRELAMELKLFIQHTELENTIFRSDHVSNNLILKGVLSKDKNKIIEAIDLTINDIPESSYPQTPSIL